MSSYREFLDRVDLDANIAGSDDPVAVLAAWTARSTWKTHVRERLAHGAVKYDGASLQRSPMDLVEEIAQEAADVSAWAAITQKTVEESPDLDEETKEHIQTALRGAATCGAMAWGYAFAAGLGISGY